MSTITMGSKKKSLFDDIFRLQSTAPELDVDPEDLQDGLKATLVDATDEAEEDVGPSSLRRRTAVISDDPKYKGKRASRKDLYSDEEEAEENGFDISTQGDSDVGQESGSKGQSDEEMSQDASGEEDGDSEEEEEDSSGEEEGGVEEDMQEAEDAKIMEANKSDDREKGKAVHGQLEVWDQLIKTRISMHKVLSLCNQLPNVDTWPHFSDVSEGFSKEAGNAHSSVRNLVTTLLEVQKSISGEEGAKRKALSEEDDEEVTSDDEGDDDDEGGGKTTSLDALDRDDPMSDIEDNEEERTRPDLPTPDSTKKGRKRKLDVDEVEGLLSQQHTSFQKYRNDTLSKWDEKTRLTHGKVRAKNFAAFEMSVLKQIEQVLVNRERLIRRIHQQRTAYRILGCPEAAEEDQRQKVEVVMDDDDDVEVEMKQRSKQDVPVNPEVIDDNDFYHVCLRDFIEMKQNEETDPVMANKQWLEIQRLRNKQKRKVDTKASKGRKIRYNIREKLKNFMTPYDKSIWADEQKDDLYKALFGGRTGGVEDATKPTEAPTINIGL